MNTDFKLQSFAFNPAFKPVAQKQSTQTPVVNNEVTVTPTESFTSTLLKTPRPGSDMEQMVEDLRNNGVMPQPQLDEVAPKVEEKTLREPTSEYMQMMVDSIKNDGSLGAGSMHVQVNDNGTIALLDDSAFFSMPGLSSEQSAEEFRHQHHLPGKDHESHGTHGDHGHGFKGDAHMAGHLGTEVVEKLGHAAHHATDAAAHGTGEAVSHAVSEKAAAVGHALSEKASAVGHHMTEVANHATETAAEATDMSAAGLNMSKEAAHHMSTAMEAALQVGTVGAGILAIPLTINGVKELKAGIKENDIEKKLEGAGGIAVGLRSGATATVMGGMLAGAETLTTVAGVASAGLGVVHAGVDTVLGIRDLKHGKTTEGLIKIGTGVAVAAAAVVGGLPLTIATIGMLGVKVGHKIYKNSQAKKAKEAAEQAKQQPQPQVESASSGQGAAVTPVLPSTQNVQLKT